MLNRLSSVAITACALLSACVFYRTNDTEDLISSSNYECPETELEGFGYAENLSKQDLQAFKDVTKDCLKKNLNEPCVLTFQKVSGHEYRGVCGPQAKGG